MKKIFTLLFAVLASTTMFAQDYYLIGDGELFGNWKLEQAILMPNGEITKELPAGNYEFKVLPQNTGWDGQLNAGSVNKAKSSANVRGTDNIHVSLAQAGSMTVKVEEGELVITGEFSATDVVKEYTIVGDPNLLGSNWDLNDANNLMTFADGVATYTIESKELAAGEYKWKVVGDHAWSVQFPQQGDFILTIAEDATYKVVFTLPVATGEGVAEATKVTDGISTITTTALNGKFIENGQIVILRGGVRYNVAGIRK